MNHTYKTIGTCSRKIDFEIKDNKVYNVRFEGGCNGNLKAVSKLVDGQEIDEVIRKLSGITCNNKNTSCGDQLARALQEIKNNN